MKRVEVLMPFINKDNNKLQKVGDIIEVSEEKLANIRAINVNMVLVLDDVETSTLDTPEVRKVKKTRTTTKTTKKDN